MLIIIGNSKRLIPLVSADILADQASTSQSPYSRLDVDRLSNLKRPNESMVVISVCLAK